ncbi:Maf family nucleotide pyrophosphatase [Pseudoclavibacter sp. 13-3]|nr:Maf family nucleotide pyrophosphatase [Pseudoclavibacter sp. 13-3]
MPFVLASTSPARLATMRSAGIEPIVVPSHVDEDAVVAAAGLAGDSVARSRDEAIGGEEFERGGRTAQIVSTLARAKARAVLAPEIDGLVLGGDSMFEIDGEPLGKPHTPQRAVERIRRMRGRTGTLYSGHWLIDHRGGSVVAEAGAWDSATVTFDDISDAEIEAYVATGEPLEVAGSFTVDGLGQAFITSVHGAPSCVIGLSVPVVRRLARELGVFWPDLWNRHDALC